MSLGPTFNDLLFLVRSHLLSFPEPPQISPADEDQVLNT